MTRSRQRTRFRFGLSLVAITGVIVPRRMRADGRQEWEFELRYRETILTVWDRLDWNNNSICSGVARAHSGMRCGYNTYDRRTKCFSICVLACERSRRIRASQDARRLGKALTGMRLPVVGMG